MMKRLHFYFTALLTLFVMGASAQTWTGNDVAEGDFYLYNIGQGKWLTSGNNWGTQASLTETGGFCSSLLLSDGKYAIKNTETRTNNKTNGPGYLGNNGYMDGEDAFYFTLTEASRTDGVKAYYIQDGTNNLQYSGSGTTVVFGAETGDNAQWVLVSRQDRLNAMANATEDNPVDATFLLKDPDFGRYKLNYDSWVWTFPGGENKNNAGDNTNFCVESYHVAFDFTQTVTGAPYGYYGVRGQAFYRQDGSNNTDLPYFYVADGATKSTFNLKTGSENSMNDASASFTNGLYFTTWGKGTYAAGNLKVGAHLDNNTALWCIWDNIQLYYYGPIDLSEYQAQLAAAVTAAQAVEGIIPAAVYSQIASVITQYNQTYTTADEYSAAITAINAAVEQYATADLVKAFSHYQEVKTAVLAVDANVSATDADTQADAATTVAGIEAAVATIRAALIADLPNVTIAEGDFLDLTNAMIDNSTVSQNIDYWTIANLSATGGSAGVTNYGETEFYNRNFDFYQTLSLGKGTYEFGVTGFHRAGNHATYFYAGNDRVLIPGVEKSVVDNMEQAKTYFDNGNGKVALKFALESETNSTRIGIVNNDTETDKWTIFRNFTLHYYGTAIDLTIYQTAYQEALTAAQAAIEDATYVHITGDERTALQTAINDTPEQTIASYQEKTNALIDATATFKAAQDSYDAYASEKAIAEMVGVTVTLSPSNAAAAAAGVDELKVQEYQYVNTEYPYDYAAVIGEFNTWTGTATVNGEAASPNTLNSQHWSGQTHTYYEQASNGWSANAWTIQYQKVVTLPAGDYMLKVAARSSFYVTSSVTCSATSNTVSLPHVGAATKGIDITGAANFGDGDFANSGSGYGWEWRFLPFSLTEETEVTMTFYGEANVTHEWMSIADGTLLCKQQLDLYAKEADYQSLSAAIEFAERKPLGFDAEEYAPYTNKTAIEALAAAKAIDPDADNLRTEVQTVTESLSNATWTLNETEMNAVYDGDFGLQPAHESGENVVLPGWTTVSGNTRLILKNTETYPALTDADAQTALFVHPGTYEYGHTVGYTMPLDGNAIYELTFKYCAWQNNNNNDFTATIKDGNNQVVATKAFGKVEGGLNTAGSLKAVTLYFMPEQDGHYILSLIADGNSSFTDVRIVKSDATNVELKGTDTAAPDAQMAFRIDTDRKLLQGLNTIILPFETTKEELGATTVLAYTGTTTADGTTTLNFVETETLSAHVPYAVMMDADATDNLSFSEKEITTSTNLTVTDTNGAFDFVGTYSEISSGNTVIVSGDLVAGVNEFVRARGGNRLQAYRAYLKKGVNPSANIAFNFNGEIITGMAATELLQQMNDDLYNLNGQRIETPQRGIYIQNGRKFIVK